MHPVPIEDRPQGTGRSRIAVSWFRQPRPTPLGTNQSMHPHQQTSKPIITTP
jgi:hypothetical protein